MQSPAASRQQCIQTGRLALTMQIRLSLYPRSVAMRAGVTWPFVSFIRGPLKLYADLSKKTISLALPPVDAGGRPANRLHTAPIS